MRAGKSKDIDIDVPADEWHGQYQQYTVGEGGACDVYDPPYVKSCTRATLHA